MQSTLKFKGRLAAIITALAFALQITAPSRVWTILFIGLGLVLLVNYFWARALQKSFKLIRERRYTWAQVGDRLEERFTIENYGDFALPALWVEITDQSTLPGYNANQATGLGANTFRRWRTEGVCEQRGIFQLGPTEVRFGDPFGLFEVRQIYATAVDFLIVPPVFPLPGIEVAPQGQFGDSAPRLYSATKSQAAATVRSFQAGDSLNRIHWPTTARRDSLYVRRLEETSSGNWWLILDLDQNTHRGEGRNSTLEKSILVASSLVDKGLAKNHAVGLLAQGQKAIWLPPQATQLQQWRILKRLAQAELGPLSLRHLLDRSRRIINQNTSLVIITASTNSDWLDALTFHLRQGVIPTVILIYTAETRSALESAYRILISQGIKTYLLDSAAFQIPTAERAAGQWEWRITGTGKAIAIHKPEGRWETMNN